MKRMSVLLAIATLLLFAIPAFAQDFPSRVEVLRRSNMRVGPGTSFSVTRVALPGEQFDVIACNADCSWYQLENERWIAAFLVRPVDRDAGPAVVVTTPTPELQATEPITTPAPIIEEIVPTPTPTPDPRVLSMPDPASMEEGRVVMVVDGDTIIVALGERFHRIQYLATSATEYGQRYYQEATERNRQLVGSRTVYLEKDVSEVDRFGRLLRYVWLPNGKLVNEILIREGLAMQAAYAPDVKYSDHFDHVQGLAQGEKLGLWGGGVLISAEAEPLELTTTLSAQGRANRNANIRSGPGADYASIGYVRTNQLLELIGQNGNGSWYQLEGGAWIAAWLVDGAPSDLPRTDGTTPTEPAVAPTPIPTPTAGAFEFETLDVAATDGEPCNCSGDLYNCRDFGSHAEAQACFEYCVAQGRGDIHLIDINNNGIACEALLP
jgi:endonuclease YncB( thermonuclease family)/uncharacterized protein YraI